MFTLNTLISLAKISCILLFRINYFDHVHVGLLCWQRICCHSHLTWKVKYLFCCLHELGSLHIYISRSFINIFNVHLFPRFHATLQGPFINAVLFLEILQVSWSTNVILNCMNIVIKRICAHGWKVFPSFYIFTDTLMQRDVSLQTYAARIPNRVLLVHVRHMAQLRTDTNKQWEGTTQSSVLSFLRCGTCYKLYHKCGQAQWIDLLPSMSQVKLHTGPQHVGKIKYRRSIARKRE